MLSLLFPFFAFAFTYYIGVLRAKFNESDEKLRLSFEKLRNRIKAKTYTALTTTTQTHRKYCRATFNLKLCRLRTPTGAFRCQSLVFMHSGIKLANADFNLNAQHVLSTVAPSPYSSICLLSFSLALPCINVVLLFNFGTLGHYQAGWFSPYQFNTNLWFSSTTHPIRNAIKSVRFYILIC